MYYFIIRFFKFYQISYRLHFIMSVLHFATSFSLKCSNFAPDNTKRKRNGLFFENMSAYFGINNIV
jgi:hypothetical protein